MIDIDKFITSILSNPKSIIDTSTQFCINKALLEQGLEFRDGSISRVEPSIPEIVEEHFDEMLEDKSNPDNLHQYLYGSNEEEKIRKDIIWCLKHSGVKESNPINPHVTTIAKDAIAWLEKQGKQKDSVVDFKAKDWYVSKVDGKIYNAKFMEKTPTNQARRLEIEKAAMSATGIIEQEEWFIKGAEWSDKNPSYISSEKQGEQKPNKCMYSKDNYIDEDRLILCGGCEEDCKLKQKPTEDTDNPDNLHQYLYGDTSILGKVRAEIKRRYEHHLGCMEGSRDDTYPEISHAHHRVIKDELFEILCFLDVLEGKSK